MVYAIIPILKRTSVRMPRGMLYFAYPVRWWYKMSHFQLRKFSDMHRIGFKAILDAHDVSLQWTMHLGNKGGKFYSEAPLRERKHLAVRLGELRAEMAPPEFLGCRQALDRLIDYLGREKIEKHTLLEFLADARRRISDHFESTYCVVMSPNEVALYESGAPLFGPEVEAKFSLMSEDIGEAGKCLVLGRSTAAVFHLMRVMELGVQKLGDELGVSFTADKNWQNILDEVNKAIKSLNHKLPRTKALAEAAAHLYNVKVAWRNEVMHPKQTYTPEQAGEIFASVRSFTQDLAAIL